MWLFLLVSGIFFLWQRMVVIPWNEYFYFKVICVSFFPSFRFSCSLSLKKKPASIWGEKKNKRSVVSWSGRDTQWNRIKYLFTEEVQSNKYYKSRFVGCYVRSWSYYWPRTFSTNVIKKHDIFYTSEILEVTSYDPLYKRSQILQPQINDGLPTNKTNK